MSSPQDPATRQREFLTVSMLRYGKFKEGWELYEERVSRLNWVGRLSFPEWRGEAVRSLLVLPEQGLGDQIQFVRYVLDLKARGIEVTLVAPPPLVRLFAALGVTVLAAVDGMEIARHDAWVAIASLPARLGAHAETISGAPYLPAAQGGGGIGLVTRGDPNYSADGNRTLPEELAAEIRAWRGVQSLHPEDTGSKDMEETARIIDRLSLVISVDTSVGHLAGAMGKPCWLLIPQIADWRWLVDREDSIWYARHRLYRQTEAGGWRGVIDRVRADLDSERPVLG
ncbi:MAG TPA: glycosyltransferase family 9 protein [Phenylobacterium sp.]|nr:glycosyltransferase family 9 protein [Phenylobacterium sp.]